MASLKIRTPALRPRTTPSAAPALETSADFQALRERHQACRSTVDTLRGQKRTLETRMAELTEKVGRAKGRLLIKPDVDEFLESLQAELHRKSVGTYEQLLTALAEDVLGSGDKIGLDLYTERGLSALDIFVDADGHREDIINGCGGSMTNVISLGLRMIATVRSGMRKFVALDEPDCWIAPSKVPNFYRVINELGERLGVQSLLISHHSTDLMPEGFAVARLRKHDGAIVCENDPSLTAWKKDQPGIRSIRLQNFMSHADTHIKLAPGATAIVGDNHIGKSVVIRGLRAAAYGEISDADLRHGEKEVMVELEIEDELLVKLSRKPGRNPVNLWTLEDKEGNIMVDEATNTEFKSGGRTVPEWVGEVLQINKFDGIEHQLSHQKFPVFLLGEAASKRASVLSIGKESGYVRKMIALQKDKSRDDAKTIKEGETDAARIQEQLEAIAGLDEIMEELEALHEKSVEISEGQARLAAIKGLLDRVSENDKIIQTLKPKLKVMADMPADLPDISANVRKREEITKLARAVQAAEQDQKLSSQTLDCMKAFPAEVPQIADLSAMKSLLDKLAAADAEVRKAGEVTKKTKDELATAHEEIAGFIKEQGGICPLCKNEIKDVEAMIDEH